MSEGSVLIVEDACESLKLLSDMLAEQGYVIRTAQNGERALSSVAAKLPDLILLDICMPGMDGFEVLRRLKAQNRSRNIPVIILSAITETESHIEGLKLGAVDFISKPYLREELLAKVHTHVELVRVRNSLEHLAEELRQANEQIQIAFSDERKQAEIALRASEARYRAVAQSANDAIITTNRTGEIVSWNRGAENLFGYKETEAMGMLLIALMPQRYRGRHLRGFGNLVEESNASSGGKVIELTGLHKDGREIPVELSLSQWEVAEGLFVTGIIRDITERKQAEMTLNEYASKLEKLSRVALEAQETERRRLAIELHDELGQALTAIKINLQAQGRFTHQTPDEINAENINIVENALQQVRRLALALRPSMLDDLGLVAALRWLAEQTESRADLVIAFHASHFKSRFSPEIETACFRITQEALTNIVRHAGAQQVEIDLYQDEDSLLLCVQDDGCGFVVPVECKHALAAGSMGVLGMQERAVLIGGHLDVQSIPGVGTRVILRCPLHTRGEVK